MRADMCASDHRPVSMDTAAALAGPGAGAGDEGELDYLSIMKEEALVPLKEDLAEWLTKILDLEITAETFLSVLDNGVAVCRLTEVIQEKSTSAPQKKETPKLANGKLKYRKNAQPGTWFARDNTANFIEWCKRNGVKEECLFETEGLVMHREERSVVLCLLELARLGYRYGLEPPNLIRMECEIEQEESGLKHPSPPASATPGGKKPAATSYKKSASKPAPKSELDREVQRVTGTCTCIKPFTITRVSEGKYNIGGKMMFVRLLHRHVMVRVGGGWDTLDHFLLKHDPCKTKEFKRDNDKSKYLHIKAKYRQ